MMPTPTRRETERGVECWQLRPSVKNCSERMPAERSAVSLTVANCCVPVRERGVAKQQLRACAQLPRSGLYQYRMKCR
jgi:hypothetical protein